MSMSDLAVIDDDAREAVSEDAVRGAFLALASGNLSSDVFSTFDKSDEATSDLVWVALSDSEPAKNNLDKTIEVQGIVGLRVELADEQSGELVPQPRMVFVDTEGKAYHVTSPVVLRDVRTLVALKGNPTPQNPIKVRFEQGGTGRRQFITLKPARKESAKK